jgi:general secretion pathway protein G
MMVEIIRRLIVAGLALGLIAGNADKITEFYDETVEHARHLATASDLRSISNMLDYHFMKKGRYPANKEFASWLSENFKESPVHALGFDHWNNRFIYETDGKRKSYVMTSTGPDGVLNTSDDLRVSGP